ncbi:hypothetical protein TWF718_005904 [Orbilia javanica]|uniref:BTB domain-containing protein n=1 Tax=Orbilia javanica TaxID=47235 RepID=A0AAN8N497_9PEZI
MEEQSGYFKALFSTGFAESKTKIVTLIDKEVDVPQAVETFLQYCYIQTYPEKGAWCGDLPLHAQVYSFSVRMQCESLRLLALKKATSLCQLQFPSNPVAIDKYSDTMAQVIRLIYGHTVDRSAAAVFGIARAVNPKLEAPQGEKVHLGSTSTVAGGITRDGFRMLLAAYSGANLAALRTCASFMKLHNSLQDFSSDLILFVEPGGSIYTGKDGIQTLDFRMAEFTLG